VAKKKGIPPVSDVGPVKELTDHQKALYADLKAILQLHVTHNRCSWDDVNNVVATLRHNTAIGPAIATDKE
jgi:hypothetical protein